VRFKSNSGYGPLALIARGLTVFAAAWTYSRGFVRGMATVGRFASRGHRFSFDPDGTYSFETIHVGDNVNLGIRPFIVAARSQVRIGSNVMLGPEVVIRGGNHRVDVVGQPMIAVAKEPGDFKFDRGVIIEDDVWVGTRAVILQGVTIGRGAVIGAGAIVTRSVPPYAIAAGNPARVVRLRWTVDVIAQHELALYPPDQRLTPAELSNLAEACARDEDLAWSAKEGRLKHAIGDAASMNG
jgi:acetyltransferase-like isoleucine patch superfamily enzyme